LASSAGSDLAGKAKDVNGIKVLAAQLDNVDPKSLRDTLDQLKNKLGSAVILLVTAKESKVSLIAGVTKDLTKSMKAGDLVKLAAEKVGGKGGGRPDMAQAGGNNPDGMADALAVVKPWVEASMN
jgi:alanyl-tRNA synthetase